MEPYFKSTLIVMGVITGGSFLGIFAFHFYEILINYTKCYKNKLPKRCIVVRYKNRNHYSNPEDLLIIKTDTPRRLYYEIMTTGPYDYISRNYGMSYITFKSIDVIGDDIDYKDTFLIRIARFMGLETKDIHSKEDLIKLIDDHITYNPDTIINEGYVEARDEFNQISQDV